MDKASSSPPDGPVVDLDHLARYTGGEATLNAEILRLFDGQVNGMVGELRAVLASRDGRRWKEIAHTIKGAARGVGAFRMGDAAAAAEPVDVQADPALAEDAITRLAAEGAAVQGFIAAYLAA